MRSSEEIEASTQQLLDDLKTIVRDGEELLAATAKDLSEKGTAARERLAAAIEVAKTTRRKLQQQALANLEAADHLVRDYPYHSAGIAFGLGILAGVLLSRR